MTGVELCGRTMNLSPGFNLIAFGDLPFNLIDNQPGLSIALNIEDMELPIIRFEGNLDFDWPIITPSHGFPGMDALSMTGIGVFADIEGSNLVLGLEGSLSFTPSGQSEEIIGVTEVEYDVANNALGLEMYLNGRWMARWMHGWIDA